MKSVANWYVRIGALVLILAVAVAALACGGNGGSVNLSPSDNTPGGSASATAKSTGVLITEDEIATLPAWQQELLSDPGWNQPFIEPRAETAIPAPTNEYFEQTIEELMAQGEKIVPRGISSGKSASWNDQGDFTPDLSVSKGEYDCPVGETPGYGCNVDHSNDYGSKDHGSDDPIVNKAYFGPPQRISYVLEGITTPNHFNGDMGGTGNDALSCVYQLFATSEEADPMDLESTATFAELSYRSDLGGDRNSGAPCAAVAYEVEGGFWKAFNREVTALPYGQSTPAYNILVAPSSDASGDEISSGDSTAQYQDFYLGDLSNCYGAGMIVGITSSTSSCDTFVDFVDQSQASGYFFRPIYGVLLRRWQDTTPPGGAGAWEGTLGWPVAGPVAYSEGAATLTARGTYFAWGMWFEKGFIWWIDYDQSTHPNTPDEGQAYGYTGSNVYCKDGVYEKGSTSYYGGAGDLAATVSIDAYRENNTEPWTTPAFENNHYMIPLNDGDGLATVEVAMSAHPYGGTPRASDCAYKHCTWAFRDGQIQAAGAAYDQAQFSTVYTYGSTSLPNMENTYVVRVQVIDSMSAKGYGDSFPIILGHGAGGGGGQVLIVRNDGNAYADNLDAIKADLDMLGVAYDETTTVSNPASYYQAYKAVIWYHGGPGGAQTGTLTTWNDEDRVWDPLLAGVPTILFSQATHYASGLVPNWLIDQGTRLTSDTVSTNWIFRAGYNYGYGYYFGGNEFYFFGHTSGRLTAGRTGAWRGQSTAGEGFSGAGSSGYIANGIVLPANVQITTWSPTNMLGINFAPYSAVATTSGFSPGVTGTNLASYGIISGGNSAAPCDGSTNFVAGPSKFYLVGYPWADVTFNGISGPVDNYLILQNLLIYMNSTITIEVGSGGPGVTPYEGDPEIVSVTPVSWEGSGGVVAGATSHEVWYDGLMPAMQYPDFSATDVYRDVSAGGGTNYIVDSAAKIEAGLNPNDIDFQFPFYGYWYDPDGSLDATPVITGDEVWVGRGGLVVEDPDTVWFRIPPQAIFTETGSGAFVDPMESYANWYAFANYDTDTMTPEIETLMGAVAWPFAGCYATTVDVVGTPALDTATKANYGSEQAHLGFNHDSEPLFMECVAHWPNEQDPGNTVKLDWNLFPGHGTGNSLGLEYGFDTAWSTFVLEQDIDPTAVYNAGAADTYVPYINRDANWFLTNIFDGNRGDANVNNRVCEFDYTLIDGFLGDLDADGTPGELVDDKFPVRVRLVTDNYVSLNNRPGVYPNHWPNASSTHTGWIEGGCYVSSEGTGAAGGLVLPDVLSVTYEPFEGSNTIFWTGTYPGSPEWTMDVTIEVGPYAGPVEFAYDLDVDPIDPVTGFTPDIQQGDIGGQGTNTYTVSFTPADIDGYGSWTNGDLLYFAVSAFPPASDPTAGTIVACPVQMWLGDVTFWEDFDPDPGVAAWAGGSIFTFGFDDAGNQPVWWVGYQNDAAMDARWGSPTLRSWYTPHANNGLGVLWYDNGSGGVSGSSNYWNLIFAPEKACSTATDVFMAARMGTVGGSSASSNHANVNYVGYSGSVWWVIMNPSYYDPSEVYGNHGQWGNTTSSEIAYLNVSDFHTAYTVVSYPGTTVTDSSGNARMCLLYQIYNAQSPAGNASDNWLITHANPGTYAPPFM